MDINLLESFSSFGGLATLNVFLSELIIKTCKINKSWVKQTISWIFPIILCIIGYIMNIGMFIPFNELVDWQGWVYTILTGLGIGLTSNGIFDITVTQNILDYIKKGIEYLMNKIKKNS